MVLLVTIGAAFLLLFTDIWARVEWHAANYLTMMKYQLNPPEEQVFVPATEIQKPILQEETLVPSITPTYTPSQSIQETIPHGSPTAPQPTALPQNVVLKDVPYVDQHGLFNYCAPANLTMGLQYWGWPGERTDVGQAVKPYEKDKNVMPYELANFVRDQTGLAVVQRSGGNLELLKTFIAEGYPVLVELGTQLTDLTGKVSWMGHYQLVYGYDDEKQIFLVQDSYRGSAFQVDYAALELDWWAFNHVFLLIHPYVAEQRVMDLLGDLADETQAFQVAVEQAEQRIKTSQGVELYFSWFNRGTSLMSLQEYTAAGEAYDRAFEVYAGLPAAQRPWRMMWYQTGPYFAYYHSGRYQDVINLATQTLDSASEPYLEESWYWRGLAKNMLGDRQGALADLERSLEYHPGFGPTVSALTTMGVNLP